VIAGEIWVYNTQIAGGFDMFRFPLCLFGFKYINFRVFLLVFFFFVVGWVLRIRVKSQLEDAGEKCMNLFFRPPIVPAFRRPALEGSGVKTFGPSRN